MSGSRYIFLGLNISESRYETNLIVVGDFDAKFRGDIINVIYFSCSCALKNCVTLLRYKTLISH